MTVRSDFSIFNYTDFPQKEIHIQIIQNLNDDYPTASRMRASCRYYQNLIDGVFPEMILWQKRSLTIHTLQGRISILENEVRKLIDLEKKNSEGIENDLKPRKNAIQLLAEYSTPKNFVCHPKSTPLDIKKNELQLLRNEKKSLSNMCKEFGSLFFPSNPLTKIFGGYKAILILPESEPTSYKSTSVSIMKTFDKWGHLLFRISDLRHTVFELKIPYWGINTIYEVKGQGYSGLRQYNDFPIFCDREETHEKVKLIEQKEQPCWHVSEIVHETPIEPYPSFFGIYEVSSQSLKLQEAIRRSTHRQFY